MYNRQQSASKTKNDNNWKDEKKMTKMYFKKVF